MSAAEPAQVPEPDAILRWAPRRLHRATEVLRANVRFDPQRT